MKKPRIIKQHVIAQEVIRMAKAIQSADQNKQHLVIIQKRSWGKGEAYRIARNNN